MLKLVNNRSQGVSNVFKTKVMRGSRGLFGQALMGFLLKFNVLENFVGKWGKLNT